MAKGFRPVERDQGFLLPPNMTDWLPAEHVVWFLIDVVAELDLSAFYQRAALRRDGQSPRSAAGRAGYDPAMLLTLLLYGYACAQRSSRQIERLCHTDIAFRLICAGDIPDHTVIARFRQTHEVAIAGLFTQVLRLCRAAGLVKLCTVAIDGTKIMANASKQATHGEQWFTEEAARMDQAADQAADQATGQAADQAADRVADRVADQVMVEQILREAAQADAAEDAEYGPARGDELPPSWHGRAGRRERIRAAQDRIVAIETARLAAEQAAEQAAAAARAQQAQLALAAAQEAFTAKVAARETAMAVWEQAWEHAVAHPGAPLPRGQAPVAVEDSVQIRKARERVEAARARATDPETAPRRGRRRDPDRVEKPPRANLTDPDSVIMPTHNGWIQGFNTQFAVSADQIIVATEVTTSPVDILSYEQMVAATEAAAALIEATDELGTLLFDAGYVSDATLAAEGPDRLIALGKTHSVQAAARDNPASGPPPPGVSVRQAMDHRLRTPEGANLYKRRGATVEPGIGNFKKILDRFSRRGLPAAISETHLTATVFNLLKIHRSATA